jgi:primary-amine oxidase
MQTDVPLVTHPLQPLSAAEIERASEILRKDLAPTARFVYVLLAEPPKADVLAHQPGDPIDRQAFIVIRERAERATYEALVSITAGEVRSWRRVPGVQTPITLEEWEGLLEVIKGDSRWREALAKRSVMNFDDVIIDPWPLGYNGPEDDPGRGRFVRPLTWVRSGPDDNGYARPVEGLVVRFDLDRMEIVEIEDHGVVPLPPRTGNYDPERIKDPANFPHFPGGTRADLKPIEITQPHGPSFSVEENLVQWQKWSFRVGFNPREGLVLHTIGYEDKGRVRPIIYRASLSEMFVPYGDPRPTHYRKNVFDMGEAGVGMLANSLELGCDCLGEVFYFDGVGNDNDGHPVTIANAICLHEEDDGQLWKHTDLLTGHVEMRRSRRLVISLVATVANYEYGYFWYLYQDGTIEHEVKLSGVISTGALAPGEKPVHGALVAPQVYGPNHQHFFNFRLDMMVDPPTRSTSSTTRPCRPVRRTPTATPGWPRQRPCGASRRHNESSTPWPGGPGRSPAPPRRTCSGRPPPTGSSPTTTPCPSLGRTPTPSAAPGSPPNTSGSPPMTPPSASPPATIPISTRVAPASPPTSAPTVGWKRPTSSSGTPAAPATWPDRRTGR